MIKIAVTGGIGSGKSYISHLLENMHIPVYNADNEAKRLTVSDAGIRGELIALLGEEVYKDGLLNKPLLASYLFFQSGACAPNQFHYPSPGTERFYRMGGTSGKV